MSALEALKFIRAQIPCSHWVVRPSFRPLHFFFIFIKLKITIIAATSVNKNTTTKTIITTTITTTTTTTTTSTTINAQCNNNTIISIIVPVYISIFFSSFFLVFFILLRAHRLASYQHEWFTSSPLLLVWIKCFSKQMEIQTHIHKHKQRDRYTNIDTTTFVLEYFVLIPKPKILFFFLKNDGFFPAFLSILSNVLLNSQGFCFKRRIVCRTLGAHPFACWLFRPFPSPSSHLHTLIFVTHTTTNYIYYHSTSSCYFPFFCFSGTSSLLT